MQHSQTQQKFKQTLLAGTLAAAISFLVTQKSFAYEMKPGDDTGIRYTTTAEQTKQQPLNNGSDSPETYTPPLSGRLDIDAPITKKVMLIIFNPILEGYGNQTLINYLDLDDPYQLSNQYAAELNQLSEGVVNYQIVETHEVDDIPIKIDGFHYTDTSYLNCWNNHSTCHSPDGANYLAMINPVQACEKKNNGNIDEVWIWGNGWFGFYESRLAGPGAFWYNSPPLEGTTCQKLLPIMGFNYGTDNDYPNWYHPVGFMLHSNGHRTESTMWHLFGSWEPEFTHEWNKFSLRNSDLSGKAGCGNTHFPPNGTSDYDYDNPTSVFSYCNDWLNFSNLTDEQQTFGCTEWDCNDDSNWMPEQHNFMQLWHARLPRYLGRNNDKWNNWWRYILDYENATIPAPTGFHDPAEADGCVARGWTCDPDKYSTQTQVEIVEVTGVNQQTTLSQVTANQTGEPVLGTLCGNSTPNRRFAYTPPPNSPLRDGQPHIIMANVIDIDAQGNPTGKKYPLNQSPRTLSCISAQPSPTPIPSPGTFKTVCPSGTPGQNGCDYIGADGIQEAIDLAPTNTQITIKNGTYERNTHISITEKNNLILTGETNTTIQNTQGGETLLVISGSSNIAINHLIFKDSGALGIEITPNASGIIINNSQIISSASHGVESRGQNITISNNLISQNTGTGIIAFDSSTHTIQNNTVVSNHRGFDGFNQSIAAIKNNIVALNTDGGIRAAAPSNFASIQYNLTFDNGEFDWNTGTGWENWPPPTNISADPQFINPSNGNYHVQLTSPACGAGESGIDIGAFPCTPPLGDTDGDSDIDLTDFDTVKNNHDITNAAADVNDDGLVNIFDLGIVVTNYNP